jgi:cellulose 1,4-beta-cellobiosidase
LNDALYFVEMKEDREKLKYPLAKSEAPYRMEYSEAECPHEMKFIKDETNVKNWKPKEINENSANDQYGT